MEKESIFVSKAGFTIKKRILVLSGKGGVGKSTVSVNLAASLAQEGFKTGLIDIDIHGPNISKMLGISEKKLTSSEGEKIIPIEVMPNLKVVSIANLVDENQPVIWRGPLKHKLIEQFVHDTEWGDLDFLVIDSPPGTGDEHLSVVSALGTLDGAILVTTPQEVANVDAKRAGFFVKKLNVNILGIVENMSAFKCPHCGNEISLFGKADNTNTAAQELNTTILTRIPFNLDIPGFGDSGKPVTFFQRGEEIELPFKELAAKVILLTKKG